MRSQRHLERPVPGAAPISRPADLTAAIEVLLDELDSVSQRASRDGDSASVPVTSIGLVSGETLHGIVVEYAAWQKTVVVRLSDGEVVRVSLRNITSVAVDLATERQNGWKLASGLVRVYR